MTTLRLLFVLCLAGLCWAEYDASVCQKLATATPNPNDPVLPELVEQFQASVEVSLQYESMSYELFEYYDRNANMAEIITHPPSGDVERIIYNFNTMRAFDIDVKDKACHAKDMSANNMSVVFGNDIILGLSNLGTHILAEESPTMYQGKTMIHGVNVDHWKRCLYLYNSSIIANYYYSVADWTPAGGISPAPVRVSVEGENQGTPVKAYYDYTSFRPYLPKDQGVFQVPLGVYCEDRQSSKALPTLPDEYFYRQEIINPELKVVHYSDVFYDYSSSLIRNDHRPTSGELTHPLREIHDYNTGVSYVMDKVKKNCTIKPLTSTMFDGKVDDRETRGRLTMKNPMEMFFLDDTYVYKGQYEVRGIMCDVFISKREDFLAEMDFPTTSIFEFFFSTPEWLQFNNDADDISRQIPVRLDVTATDGSYRFQYNFYDFDEGGAPFQVFDVSSCYEESAQKRIAVEFPGLFSPEELSEEQQFLTSYRAVLSSHAGISPSRIQDLKMIYDSKKPAVYVLSSLLDLPPSYNPPSAVQYVQLRGKCVGADHAPIFTLKAANQGDCMNWCNRDVRCHSLVFCTEANETCTLYDKKMTADDLMNDTQCSFHQRASVSMAGVQSNLSEAWINVKNAVYLDHIVVPLVVAGQEKKEYQADQVHGDILEDEFSEFSPRSNLLKTFERVPNTVVFGLVGQLQKHVSVDECARRCVKEKKFICHSFNYYKNTGGCQTTGYHPITHVNQTEPSDSGVNYARNFLDEFIISPGLTVPPFLAPADDSFMTSADCAVRCAFEDSDDDICRSFYFCTYGGVSSCTVSHHRELVEPDHSHSELPGCQFYQRNLIGDFAVRGQHLTDLTEGVVVKDVSVEECSEICSSNSECPSFDFCVEGETEFCFLPMNNLTSPVVKPWTVDCQHYERLSRNVAPGPIPDHPRSTGRLVTSGYTGGDMAGIAISMLLAGALMGALAILVFKGRNQSDDKEQLTTSGRQNVAMSHIEDA